MYEAGPYAGFGTRVQKAFMGMASDDVDPALVARAVVGIVAPLGLRPFSVVVDPTQDEAAIDLAVTARLQAGLPHGIGLGALLRPTVRTDPP